MTTKARRKLMERGVKLFVAADNKLDHPRNVLKGDGWDDLNILELMTLLDQELAEFKHCAYKLDGGVFNGIPIESWSNALLDEGGDVVNVLRFICSKYGAI